MCMCMCVRVCLCVGVCAFASEMLSFTLLLAALVATTGATRGRRPNALLILVDDLRAPLGEPPVRTPHCAALAAQGLTFENAYAQQALCAPSRNSLLTGRRPDTLRLYDFYNYWREFTGNFTTIPQYFKENGYKTYSFGKIFHPGISSNRTDDYPLSWSEPTYHPTTESYMNAKVCMDKLTGKLSRNLICPVIVKFQPEKTLPDIQIANAAIEKLKDLNKASNDPYFIAIGFHKPHIPLKFPVEYLDYYPLSDITLPKMAQKPPTMPTVAWNPWTDVRARDDIRNLNISFPFGIMPDEWILKIKQSYFASITYIDDLIGNVLKNVDLSNTIVVLTSDHGWSLGEHGLWAKYSNFDLALKVPLIIYDPNHKTDHPIKTKAIVELVDLFPTLAELSGITNKFPRCKQKHAILCSEGRSLVPLIKNLSKNKSIGWNHAAYSQFPRPGVFPTIKPNSDKPRLNKIKVMGYSIRTERFRYTEWVKFNRKTFMANWNKVYGRELYDHEVDEEENLNLANRNQLKDIREYLSERLKRQQ